MIKDYREMCTDAYIIEYRHTDRELLAGDIGDLYKFLKKVMKTDINENNKINRNNERSLERKSNCNL